MKTLLCTAARGRFYLAFLLFLFGASNGFGQAFTATWNLTSNGQGTDDSAAITTTNLAVGSGLGTPSYSSTNGVTTGSWVNDASSLQGNEYYEYEVVPATNTKLAINSVNFNHSVTAGDWLAAAYYSLDGFATSGVLLGNFTSASTNQTAQSFSGLSITVNPGQTFSVRVYAWESDGSGRSFRNRNFVISGTSCTIPVIGTQPTAQTVCAGSPLTLSVTASNATSYQWKKGGTDIPSATSSTYNVSAAAAGDAGSYSVAVINACQTVTSNSVNVTVNPVLAASVSISASNTTICQGTSVTFTATPVNATSPTYQWKLNGSNVGTNSATYSNNALTNGATITCTITASTPCRTGLPATSNTITMTVNPQLPASVSISASETTICAGTQVTFTATPTNGGTTPSYQWKVNGSNVGSNSATFQSSSLNNGDSVTCVMTSNATPCLTGSPATSNAVVMTVNQVPTAVVPSPALSTICQNTIVPLSATGGVTTNYPISAENFEGATLSFTAAGTSSTGSPFTLRSSPYNVALVATFESPDDSKFMLANQGTLFSTSTANTTLTSNPINTTGYSSLTLSFKHTYKKGSESGVSVQVSTNGTSWTNVKTYTSNQGAEAGFVTDNIPLNSYINSTSLQIRFNYAASLGILSSAWWAIDDVQLSGGGPLIVWSPATGLYTDAAATVAYSGQSAFKVYAKPSETTTYTATSTSPFGCGTQSGELTINVNPLPKLASVSQAAVVCQDTQATINLTGLLADTTSNISYTINGGPVQNLTGIVSDASGNASFNLNLPLALNGQTLAITNIQRTDLPFACAFAPTSGNTVALQVNANVTYYADADSDNYGDAAISQVSCMGAPVGFVTDNTDCNDADATKHTSYAFYSDADHDNFGTGSLVTVCAVDADTPPLGYSLNATDCDDANAAIHATFLFYADLDGDGFGSGSQVSVCAVDAATPPTGYALTGDDCNDSNASMHAEFPFYTDEDGDTCGTGDLVNVCAVDALTAPQFFSVNNIDCDDTLAAVNPLQAEILYNGIDDNCDGQLDEGHQLLSQVLPSQCGTTLTTLSSLVAAVSFGAPVNGYRFKVLNMTTNQEQVIERNVPHFQLTMLGAVDYATTYQISVMLKRNGIWLNYYGPSCLVSTPAVLDSSGAAQVNPSQCGFTLPTISSLVATTSLAGVTGYRFRITNMTDPTAPNQVQILDRPLHWFSLTMLETFAYGTTYQIEVAVKTTGDYSGFGAPCAVSSPPVPTLTNCGATIPTKGTLVTTSSLNRVTSCRFSITNMDTFVETIVDRPLHHFTFNNVPGYVPGATYAVKVALMTSGIWSPYGDACTIIAPGILRQEIKGDVQDEQPQIAFRVVNYPNPYSESFALDLDLPSDENIRISVYDMLGKVVETREVKAIDIESQQFGSGYAAGVYNIVVSQGENVRTLRAIKR